MKTLSVTWMNGQQRKFDPVRYVISSGMLSMSFSDRLMKTIPLHNVMIVEEEE